MRRLLPDPGPTTVATQLEDYRPWQEPPRERPFLATNFAVTLDGRATIGGVSGPIGSDSDTAMLSGLRGRFDALMIGAGTMRAERYGRIAAGAEARRRRERVGLAPDPLMVIVSGRLDLPWDAPLFAEGGRVMILTSSAAEPPETATDLDLVRFDGPVDLAEALRALRREHGVRALLCEGGPHLHAQLHAAHLVDEMFITVAPKLTGSGGPALIQGDLPAVVELELAWLLEADGEMLCRYRVR